MNEKTVTKMLVKVDKEIVPLVQALSKFDRLVILDSSAGSKRLEALVAFEFGTDWLDLVEFCLILSRILCKDTTLDETTYTVSVEWTNAGGNPIGYVRLPKEYIIAVAEAINKMPHTSLQFTTAS